MPDGTGSANRRCSSKTERQKQCYNMRPDYWPLGGQGSPMKGRSTSKVAARAEKAAHYGSGLGSGN
jgi:hypothetical protein